MCIGGLIYYTRYNFVFFSNIILTASSKASKTVCERFLLASVLYLGIRLLIIYNYLQGVILSKICINNHSLDNKNKVYILGPFVIDST